MRTLIVLSILLVFTTSMVCADQSENLESQRKNTPGHPERLMGNEIGMFRTTRIKLIKKTDTGTFARYEPFDDGREIIVRRGKEIGHNYGIEQSRKKVQVNGGYFWLVRFKRILSPPPLSPGQPPLSDEASKNYLPVKEVLFLPDAEVLIHREPKGFSDEEVARILQFISVN